MCRWVNVLLVGTYLFLSVGLLIVLATIPGFRLSNVFRWVLMLGWSLLCLGKVWLTERLLTTLRPTFRPPILSEEDRLCAAMREVMSHSGCRVRPRFLIDGDPAGFSRPAGYRTIIIHSGALLWASDGELQAAMAYQLTQLGDGSPVMEEVARMASPMALGFRKLCQVVTRGFRPSWLMGLLFTVLTFPGLLILLPFYLLEKLFNLLRWGYGHWQVLHADACVFRLGFGDGWRAWLEKSSLGANAGRIRRLEKMAGLRE